MLNLHGIFPPVATPFTERGDLDLDALQFNAHRWMQTRLRGLVVLGTNGVAAYLDGDESEAVVAAARACMPADRTLVAGTGHDATRQTIRACERAAKAGADAVLVRTPGAFKGLMTGEAFVRHFRAVADASPVPVLLYNFANNFGVNMPTSAIVALAEHPNIVGMKESGGDISQINEQVGATPASVSCSSTNTSSSGLVILMPAPALLVIDGSPLFSTSWERLMMIWSPALPVTTMPPVVVTTPSCRVMVMSPLVPAE